jgi:antitoxin component of MazEF toxin-antitoxin module
MGYIDRTMITTIRRSGNSFVIRVPREEMERIGVQEGEHVSVEIRALDVRPRLSADLRASVDAEIARSARAFERLANA